MNHRDFSGGIPQAVRRDGPANRSPLAPRAEAGDGRFGRRALPLAVAGLLWLGGCGCGGSDFPSVTGTVKLNGQPLTAGKLVFHPTGVGTQGYASIQPDGSYEVRTGNQAGLAEGSYIVTVHAAAEAGASRIPPKYSDAAQSDQKITVVAGDNPFDIDIKP